MNQKVINHYISQAKDEIMRIENAPLDIPKENIYENLVLSERKNNSDGGSNDSDVLLNENPKTFTPKLYEIDLNDILGYEN